MFGLSAVLIWSLTCGTSFSNYPGSALLAEREEFKSGIQHLLM